MSRPKSGRTRQSTSRVLKTVCDLDLRLHVMFFGLQEEL